MPRYRRSAGELVEPVQCIDCPQLTQTPRRSRCTRCYWRAKRRGLLDEPACRDCGTEDPIVLVGTREGPRCFNCRARAEHERLTA